MRFDSVSTIYRKEMLDSVRDHRTLLSMVVVPLIALPVLSLFVVKMVTVVERRAGAKAQTIAISGAERLPGLLNALAGAGLKFVPREDLEAAIESKEFAAGVEPVELPDGRKEVRIYADLTRQDSEMAAQRIRAALDQFKETNARIRLREMGVPDEVLTPFTVERVNVAQKKMAGFMWGSVLGYVVVFLMSSGGMYAAIDLTAGEKERRTLEILLSAPAGRSEIILAKILATTTAVFVTAFLTLASLAVSFVYIGRQVAQPMLKALSEGVPLDIGTLGLILLALLPTAVMIASIMVAVALFAKSYKEAVSYLTPVMIAAIFPLIAGLLPGTQLTPALALIPLFNVCQLMKEIFLGDYSRLSLVITLVSNTVYAAAAYYFAVRVFKSESVLFRT
ncbi:MAG TPA: ABC transporter permease subunit [Bryobacteraceae bacterium]|nr:ABC transporter permease subunit [Bryobacteraceae bacterium]HOQ46235.1 ABC transporter permease subunit [Bryobacteraceae bacterium]